jgi:hypothetical protein
MINFLIYDSLWASYWYDKVHKSTGFATSSSKIDESTNENNEKKYPAFDAEQICVYRDALPFYESLRRYAIGFDSLNPGNLYIYVYIPNDLFS